MRKARYMCAQTNTCVHCFFSTANAQGAIWAHTVTCTFTVLFSAGKCARLNIYTHKRMRAALPAAALNAQAAHRAAL